MTKAQLLERAYTVVTGDRERDYGSAKDNFQDIASIASVLLEPKLRAELSPADVALFMLAVKLCRLKTSPDHADTWVDVAGYAACGAEVTDAEL